LTPKPLFELQTLEVRNFIEYEYKMLELIIVIFNALDLRVTKVTIYTIAMKMLKKNKRG